MDANVEQASPANSNLFYIWSRGLRNTLLFPIDLRPNHPQATQITYYSAAGACRTAHPAWHLLIHAAGAPAYVFLLAFYYCVPSMELKLTSRSEAHDDQRSLPHALPTNG